MNSTSSSSPVEIHGVALEKGLHSSANAGWVSTCGVFDMVAGRILAGVLLLDLELNSGTQTLGPAVMLDIAHDFG